MKSGAEDIVSALKRAEVEVVFGIPSIHNIRLYEALRKEPSIRHILCRHEATAAHMADGYARTAGRLGVMLASTGPGTAYVIPAIQEAWGSSSPVLLITTNIASVKVGKGVGALHEFESQDALFHTITKATYSIRSSEEIGTLCAAAIRNALSGRPGPVYLEVPTDLLDMPAPRFQGSGPRVQKKETAAIPGLEEAAALLRNARRPVLFVGTEALRARIEEEIRNLSEILRSPVITTTNSKGIIPEDHPLAFGNAVRRGTVREMVQSSDLVLALGTRLREVDAKRRGLELPRVIHVDWDHRWVSRNFETEIALVGPIPAIVKAIIEALGGGVQQGKGGSEWVGEARRQAEEELSNIRRERRELQYLDAIRKALPRDSLFFIDNTQLGYWAEYFYPCYCPGGLTGAKGSSTIGFAFAAAMGAKIAVPETPVVAMIGDGGFLYSSQELATCIRHGIGFPLIVVNDGAYGVISFLQRMAFKREYESRLVNPDFVSLADAYGIKGTRVNSPQALAPALQKALHSSEITLIELVDDFPEPPFGLY